MNVGLNHARVAEDGGPESMRTLPPNRGVPVMPSRLEFAFSKDLPPLTLNPKPATRNPHASSGAKSEEPTRLLVLISRLGDLGLDTLYKLGGRGGPYSTIRLITPNEQQIIFPTLPLIRSVENFLGFLSNQ